MTKLDNIFTENHYLGTLVEISLNFAKLKMHSNIINNYSIIDKNIFSLGRINDFCIIQSNTSLVLAKITHITTEKADSKTIENKVYNINTNELSTMSYLQYLGCYTLPNLAFKNGLDVYPQIGDRVYMVNQAWIEKCIEVESEDKKDVSLFIGKEKYFNVEIKLNPQTIFTKHCAIVGTTGSGKSNSVAKIIEEFLKNSNHNGKMILIDPSGEYTGFSTESKYKEKVEYSTENWHINNTKLDNDDWFALLQPSDKTQSPCLEESLAEYKKRYTMTDDELNTAVNTKKAEFIYSCQMESFKSTSNPKKRPKSFNPSLWKYYHCEDKFNDEQKTEPELEDIKENLNSLCPFPLTPFKLLSNILLENTGGLNFGNLTTNKYNYADIQPLIHRVKNIENNDEMNWLAMDPSKNKQEKTIHERLESFLEGSEKKLFIIDCSTLTNRHNSKEFFVNLISNYILKKKKTEYKKKKEYKDKITPLVIVIDEAHQFLNKKMNHNDATYELNATAIIAKEGRKYGLHLAIATQRPRDIPEHILSQISFILAHRINNENDLNLIRNGVGNADESIIKSLPTLQDGEAYMFSLDIKLPLRIKIQEASCKPKSENVPWTKQPSNI